MSCCTTHGTNTFFSKNAKRYVKQFRRRGVDKPSRLILDALVSLGVESQSLLEIGCGVGGLHLTLLKRGASKAQGVEVSEGMLAAARELAAEMGVREKVEYLQGDFVDLNGRVKSADVVILDKVVCCYQLPDGLIARATEKSASLLAVSYPRNGLLARLGFTSMEFLGEVLGWSFHPYYHDPEMLDAAIGAAGFAEVYAGCTLIWQVKLFKRVR
jgi:2-polyprenyl-3-methyl-5-hydroxy-6-metoxy-1,4-benzoquinol methylase